MPDVPRVLDLTGVDGPKRLVHTKEFPLMGKRFGNCFSRHGLGLAERDNK
jgi:hypothetical protein